MRILVKLVIVGLLLVGTFLFSYKAQQPVTPRKPPTNVPRSKKTNHDLLTTKQLPIKKWSCLIGLVCLTTL